MWRGVEMEHERKRRRATSGGGGGLPGDVIFEVLKKLPVKCLLRFRTVSKLWCSVIDDPLFAKHHHLAQYSHTRGGGGSDIDGIKLIGLPILNGRTNEFYRIDPARLDGPLLHRRQTISSEPLLADPIHCVNGLVCFRDLIWNPATNESIPFPHHDHDHDIKLLPRGPYEQYKFLFGFDGSSDAYKVITFRYVNDNQCIPLLQKYPIRCHVWTVGGSTGWRDFNVSNMPSDFHHLQDNKSVAIGDVIYCVAGIGDDFFEWRIFAFDLRREKLHILSLPLNFDCSRCRSARYIGPCLVDLRGHLGVVDSGMSTISVLNGGGEQKQEGYSWRDQEKLQIPREWRSGLPVFADRWELRGLRASTDLYNCPINHRYTLLGSLPTGEMLFEARDIDPGLHKIRIIAYFCYDHETKKTSTVLDLRREALRHPRGRRCVELFLFSYVETVFRLKRSIPAGPQRTMIRS